MRKKILYFIIFTIAAILQLSVIPVIFNGKEIPDLILMLILAWSVLDGFFAFFSWAIFFGIYYDLINYSIIGTHSLIFVMVLYLVSFFSRRLTVDFKGVGAILLLVYVIVSILASHFIVAMVAAWKLDMLPDFWKIFGSFSGVTLEIVYNSVIFLICFALIKKAKKFYAIEI